MQEHQPIETPEAFEALLEKTLHERSSTQPLAGLEHRILAHTSAETRVVPVAQGINLWLPWSYAAAALLAVLVASGLGLRSWKGAHVSRAVHPGSTSSLHAAGKAPSKGFSKENMVGSTVLPSRTRVPTRLRGMNAHPPSSSSPEETGAASSAEAQLSAEERYPRLDTFPSAPDSSEPDVPSGQVRRSALHDSVVLKADAPLDIDKVTIKPITIADLSTIQELP